MLALLSATPVFADTSSFQNNLYYGIANNADVVQLQEFLITQGDLRGTATGNFYSLTLAGVKKFQQANNLPVSGYFGVLSRGVANTILAQSIIAPNATELGTSTPQTSTTTATIKNTNSTACPVFTTPTGMVVDCNGNIIFTPQQVQNVQNATISTSLASSTTQNNPSQITPTCMLTAKTVFHNNPTYNVPTWYTVEVGWSLTPSDYQGAALPGMNVVIYQDGVLMDSVPYSPAQFHVWDSTKSLTIGTTYDYKMEVSFGGLTGSCTTTVAVPTNG